MNPLLWAIFFIFIATLFNLKRIIKWIHEQRRMVTLINKIPGPKSLPILGNALSFSPDSEKSTYQMEYFFRIFTEDRNNAGVMRLWLGPKPIVIIYKAETIKVVVR
jgi:cytochrome P450 family 4